MRKLHHPAISIVLLSVFLGFSIACSHSANDDTIVKDIQDKLAADPDTQSSQIAVASKDGKVSLKGSVPTPAVQQKAEQIAKNEPGVSGVDDETAVQAPAAAPAAAAPTPAPAPEKAVEKPKPEPLVIPTGTTLTVRTGQALSSKDSQTGQTFTATLAQPVSVGGRTAIPAGSTVSGTVVAAKTKGKIKGEGELDLALTSVSIGGRTYPIQTQTLTNTVSGKGKRTAVTTGGGAAGGALIGGLAGGGKGAGIGALAGAGAGLLGGALTGNKQIEIPAETALSFKLSSSMTIPPSGE
jgi:BON domain